MTTTKTNHQPSNPIQSCCEKIETAHCSIMNNPSRILFAFSQPTVPTGLTSRLAGFSLSTHAYHKPQQLRNSQVAAKTKPRTSTSHGSSCLVLVSCCCSCRLSLLQCFIYEPHFVFPSFFTCALQVFIAHRKNQNPHRMHHPLCPTNRIYSLVQQEDAF
jgi:hypothetical protein